MEAEPMVAGMRIYLKLLRAQLSTVLPLHGGRGKGLYNFIHVQHKEVHIKPRTILPAYEVINVHPGAASGLP